LLNDVIPGATTVLYANGNALFLELIGEDLCDEMVSLIGVEDLVGDEIIASTLRIRQSRANLLALLSFINSLPIVIAPELHFSSPAAFASIALNCRNLPDSLHPLATVC